MINIFIPGTSIKFIGETGARWIHGNFYTYIGDCSVVDKDGEVKKLLMIKYLKNNFISIEEERDKKISLLLE
jgi:hypothetical protein